MKIGKIILNQHGLPLKKDQTPHEYYNLFIENFDDVLRYKEFYEPISAEKTVHSLFGFKSQKMREDFSDYLQHETTASPEAKLIAQRINYGNKRVSILEFAQMNDDIMSNKLQSISKLINRGFIVRINKSGGFSNITKDEMLKYNELFEPTDKQIQSFIDTGKIDLNILVINNQETIIIENYKMVSKDFIDKIYELTNSEHVECITNFRNKCVGLSDTDIINIFKNAFDTGLKNICFETTGQDLHQIKKMHGMVIHLLKSFDIKLNIYIKTFDQSVIKLFKETKAFNTIIIE